MKRIVVAAALGECVHVAGDGRRARIAVNPDGRPLAEREWLAALAERTPAQRSRG